MRLEILSAIAQLTAALGVIVSLFCRAAQIRQNIRSMRAIVVDSRSHSLVDLPEPQAGDLQKLQAFSAVVEDWDGSREEDRVRTVPFIFARFKLFENAWFQKRLGTLEPQQWEAWDAYILMYYHRPGVKIWWQMRRAAFAAGFRDYVELTHPVKDLPPISEIVRGKP